MTAPRPATVAAALNSASRLLDTCDRLGQVLDDNLPPHGITRPGPAALIEHDEYTTISAELRAEIRRRFATATAAVRAWEPGT